MSELLDNVVSLFEDHILISVLQLIDKRLPKKVREIYGPRMEESKFIMDFKQDILTNVPKMLEELEHQEVPVNWMQVPPKHHRQQKQNVPYKFRNQNTKLY